MAEKEKHEFVYCVLGDTWGPHPATENGYKGCRGGFIVQYGIENFGFGEVTFVIRLDGTLECDPECCSPEFVQEVMVELVKRAWFNHLGDNGKELRTPIVDDKNQHGTRSDESDVISFVVHYKGTNRKDADLERIRKEIKFVEEKDGAFLVEVKVDDIDNVRAIVDQMPGWDMVQDIVWAPETIKKVEEKENLS